MMLSGEDITTTALANARELRQQAPKIKHKKTTDINCQLFFLCLMRDNR